MKLSKAQRAMRSQAAEEFLVELARGIPEDQRAMVGYAEEATVRTDEDGKKLNAGWWPVPWKQGKYINENANCYVCISSSIQTPNPKTGKMRYWRGEAAFGRGLALMVDDIGDGKGSKGDFQRDEFAARLQPTAIVETSPGNYQFWYFFDEPVEDMVEYKAFIRCFVAAVIDGAGGDHTIKDVSRFGRMPTGYNNKRNKDDSFKYADPDGDCFECNLYHADYSKRYSMQDIAKAFGFQIVIPAQVKVHVDPDEWKYDQVWLQMAIQVCNKFSWGESANGRVEMNMSGKYRIRCPWGDSHSNGDPYGAYFRGPIPGAEHEYVFGCGHDGCRQAGRTWAPFIDQIVMPVVEERLERINVQNAGT